MSFEPAAGADVQPTPTFLSTLREIAASRAFVLLTVGASFTTFVGYGKGVWQTVYFIRVFELSPGQVGLWLGVLSGVAGIFGTWLGGALADRFGKANPKGPGRPRQHLR